MMNVLLQSVTIIDDTNPFHLKKADILIKDGVIVAIESPGGAPPSNNDLPDFRIIDGTHAYVSAGWVDMQADFGDPGYEHKEDLTSGSLAAAAGGFTEVALLPNTQPVIQTKNDVLYLKRRGQGLVSLLPIAAVTRDAKGEELTEMIDLHHAGAVAFSDGVHPLWHTQVMLKALEYVQKFDGLLINRPEDVHLNMFGTMHEGLQSTLLGMKGMPVLAETVAIERDLSLLRYVKELAIDQPPRLHFSNISAAASVALIRQAKKQGLPVSCDVAIHQLIFEDTDLQDFDTNYKVNPPLRTAEDIEALKEGLQDGTIDAIVSAHQPQDEESKKCEFDLAAFGMTGLQTFFPILNSLVSNVLPLELLMKKVTTGPRKLLKLPATGIKVNEEAHLTMFQPQQNWQLNDASNLSKSKNNPLFGKELNGKVLAVFHHRQQWIDSM